MTSSKRQGLIVRIQVRDEHGRVVGETDAVSLKGLLCLAHDEELSSVRTRIVELPSKANGERAVVRALVQTRRGIFTGTGDATPENVNPEVSGHIVRVAESRAIARALRLAVNIGEVAIEELGRAAVIRGVRSGKPTAEVPDGNDTTNGERPGSARPPRFRGRDDRPTEAMDGDKRAMSDEQRKLLYRLAFNLGETRESATNRVLKALGVERLEWATRRMASVAIDALKEEIAARSSGRANGRENGATHG